MKRDVVLLVVLSSIVLLATPAALGDVLLLDGGGRVEGVVTDRGRSVEVKSLSGSVIVRKDEILDRVVTPYITELYEERLRRLPDGDVGAHFRLFQWCRKNRLLKRADVHLQRTIAVDPEHAEARAILGHVKFKGVWMDADQARVAAMGEKGFIRYEGRYFTESGLLAFLDARREEQKIEAEIDRRRAEREAAERRAREEEERIRLIAAERKLLEDALAEAEQIRQERDALLLQNRDLIDLVRDLSWNSGWIGTWGVSYGGWGNSRRTLRRPRPVPYGPRIGIRYDGGNVQVRGVVR
jgi:hypothetical protein